jgi:hypothetical protein
MEDAGASRQRLGNGLAEGEVLAAGEDEAARAGIPVHLHLQVGEQCGSLLDLVQDRSFGYLGQESTRIGQGEFPDVQRLQVQVRLVREKHAAQRGLAGLAGAGQGHHRVHGNPFQEGMGQGARDHATRIGPFTKFAIGLHI